MRRPRRAPFLVRASPTIFGGRGSLAHREGFGTIPEAARGGSRSCRSGAPPRRDPLRSSPPLVFSDPDPPGSRSPLIPIPIRCAFDESEHAWIPWRSAGSTLPSTPFPAESRSRVRKLRTGSRPCPREGPEGVKEGLPQGTARRVDPSTMARAEDSNGPDAHQAKRSRLRAESAGRAGDHPPRGASPARRAS